MKLGLKLWSTNDFYIEEAIKLYNKNVYNYIELYIVPDSLKYLSLWKNLNIPIILHAPHSYSGFNPSITKLKSQNLKLLEQVDVYRESLNPKFIVFHPGIDGKINETINQFNYFEKELRNIFDIALVENKPQEGLKGEYCIGSSPEEIRLILKETNMGFCYDIGHSICYSKSHNLNYFDVINKFLALKPKMFHLSDGDLKSKKDMHLNLGKGNNDLSEIKKRIPDNGIVTIETNKQEKNKLNEFYNDIRYFVGLEDEYFS